MAGGYEYFIESFEDREVDRTGENLWRRPPDGTNWEYLSFWDWEWHAIGEDTRVRQGPDPDGLTTVTPERARELADDHARWSLYWAQFRAEPASGQRPRTVVRRKPSPERERDEVFGRDNMWIRTTAVFDSHDPRLLDPPVLVPITTEEAENIIREARGVEGATAW